MDSEKIRDKIIDIESEMKRIGFWQSESLDESAYDAKEAFCADTMTFAQWLQFILIPQVNKTLDGGAEWPKESMVGVYATQQYMFFKPTDDVNVFSKQGTLEGKEEKLVRMLNEFDDLINR